MTKLSFLVTSIFIFLAAVMWYLANASYEEHIHNKVKILSQDATHFQVELGAIKQENNKIDIQSISFLNKNNSDSVTNLFLTNIQVVIGQESVKKKTKKNIIIIEQLTIETIQTNFYSFTDKEALINQLTSSLALLPTVEETLKINKKTPLVILKQLMINNKSVDIFVNNEVEKTEQQLIREVLLYLLTEH